ncbi:hypothetical protein HK101_004625 [Irineochytrium annulatum]|nr:hypothetical protein HK101_004625 [Irineochytrium annulatum]
MGISEMNDLLILDQNTNDAVKLLQPTIDVGLVKVKGKREELHVFGLPWLSHVEEDSHRKIFDYQRERDLIAKMFNCWLQAREKSVIFIEGLSGMGKTCLANFTISLAKSKGIKVCLVQAGVDVKFAPLLSMIAPDFCFGDSSDIDSLDNQAKNYKLKAVIAKIVAHFAQNNSAGNPLFLEMTVEVAITKINSDLMVDENCELTLRDQSVDPASILSDLSSAILFQFDRLSSIFQSILKTASVLGQYFSVSHVLTLMKLALSEEEVIQIIKENDVYNFIIIEESGEDNSGSSACFFRHVKISAAIYESLSFEERLKTNAAVGNMFELQLDDSNRQMLLPVLEFHYSRTADVQKKVVYKEELGQLKVYAF